MLIQLSISRFGVPAGWTVRREDFLNPGIPTSQVRGWTHYLDARRKPGHRVHHWAGEWQDSDGGILAYDLTYRTATEQPATCDLTVQAMHLSKTTVREIKVTAAVRRVLP